MRLIKRLLTLVATVTLSALTLCGCNLSIYRYDNAELYTAGSFTYEASDVQTVDLDWVEGNVTIKKAQGNTCSVTENNPAQSLDAQVHYYLDGTTLRVKYCKSGYWIKDVNATNKTLLLEVPEGVSLVLSSVSSVITIETNAFASLNADLVAGSLTASDLSVPTVNVSDVGADVHLGVSGVASVFAETVGGNVTLAIHDSAVPAPTVLVKTVGGNVDLSLEIEASATLETVGGNVTLMLEEGFGAQVTYATVGGSFFSQKEFVKTGNTYSFSPQGSAPTCAVAVNTVGGNLFVL